jgi:hypothetical protein
MPPLCPSFNCLRCVKSGVTKRKWKHGMQRERGRDNCLVMLGNSLVAPNTSIYWIFILLLSWMLQIQTFFSKTIFWTVCMVDDSSVLGWARPSKFSVQLYYQHPNDIPTNRVDYSTQSGDKMHNQQFHFFPKILILGASVFLGGWITWTVCQLWVGLGPVLFFTKCVELQ